VVFTRYQRGARLALLVQEIVEVAFMGKQCADLTLKDLMVPFPVKLVG